MRFLTSVVVAASVFGALWLVVGRTQGAGYSWQAAAFGAFVGASTALYLEWERRDQIWGPIRGFWSDKQGAEERRRTRERLAKERIHMLASAQAHKAAPNTSGK